MRKSMFQNSTYASTGPFLPFYIIVPRTREDIIQKQDFLKNLFSIIFKM